MSNSLLARAAKNTGSAKLLTMYSPEEWAEIQKIWRFFARPEQLEPDGDWNTWLILAGRAWGKSRAGAETVRGWAMKYPGCKIALVARTAADVRDVMVRALMTPWNGGTLAEIPIHNPSNSILTWSNGSVAKTYSAEEPNALRGPEHDGFWADEIASWQYAQATWHEGIKMGLRGHAMGRPRGIVTTTPRPTPFIRELVNTPGVIVTKGITYDNAVNLPDAYIAEMRERYGQSRLGRQEIYADLLDDIEGALWKHDQIDACRRPAPSDMSRIVVAVDPSGSAKKTADEAGIVVAGLADCNCLGRTDQHGFVFEDLSGRYAPRDMATTAIAAYHKYQADKLVAEDNFGGQIIADLVRLTDRSVAYRAVHASRGKIIRAEPVAALYEAGRVHHVGLHRELEDEMCFPAGTLVQTARGQVAIENVTVLDLVLTRRGYRRVLWSGQTGIKQLTELKISGKSSLLCTPNHPIYVIDKGFVPCIEVETSDRLLLCTQLNDRGLPLKESATFSQTTVTTKPVAPVDVDCFIAPYGNQKTVQYQSDGTFTTKTKIAGITSSGILPLSLGQITKKSTVSPAPGLSHFTSRALDAKQNGRQENQERLSVSHAARSFSPLPTIEDRALVSVGTAVPVYDLTVEGEHEFFANNVLVHNCSFAPMIEGRKPGVMSPSKSPGRLDALVWALTDLMLGESNASLGNRDFKSPGWTFSTSTSSVSEEDED